MKNVSQLDRIFRLLLGVAMLQVAYFWMGGAGQYILYGLGIIMLVTAAIGYCPLYQLFKFSSYRDTAYKLGKIGATVVAIGLVTLVVGGSYASAFFSKKLYLEDFNAMNNFYKQALFQTGQQNRAEAVDNYEQLVVAYADFQDKYTDYHPYALKSDPQFDADLTRVSAMLTAVDDEVHTGDLQQAHLALEEVRPIFQDIFKRNGFSMLSVALVDFHDAMELVLDAANAQDAPQVLALYPEVDTKLKAVEAEANDAAIQAIRTNLETLVASAKSDNLKALPDQANLLKSSFVKVYLQRG